MTRLRGLRLAVIAAFCAASAVAEGGSYPWKNGNSFEIYRVGGVESAYRPGSRITLEVLGRSLATRVSPDPQNGFHVQVSIDHADLSRSVAGANGEWNDGLRGWRVELAAPREPRESYRLQVHLYCAVDSSLCAETYGKAAQVVETFHFEVR